MFTVDELKLIATCARTTLAAGAQQISDDQLQLVAALPAKCRGQIELLLNTPQPGVSAGE